MGGLAPVLPGGSNGRGGLLGHGTNAPLYTTSFTAARPKAREDTERHQGRLAEALELDRAQRVLEFRENAPSQKHLTAKHMDIDPGAKTAWKCGEWIMGGPAISIALSPCLYPKGTEHVHRKVISSGD